MTTPHHPSGYQADDLQIAPLLRYSVYLLLLLVASLGVCAWLGGWFDETPPLSSDRHPRADSREPTPAPLLQASPNPDLDDYRASMQQGLESYRWVDPGERVVQVPIDRAIELLLEEPPASVEGPR